MKKAQIVGIHYHDDFLIVSRLDGSEETHSHPPVVGPDADTSRDWRKEIVDALRKADADAIAAEADPK